MNKKILSSLLAGSVFFSALSYLPFSLNSGIYAAEASKQVESVFSKVPLNQYNLTEERTLFDYNWKFHLGDVPGVTNPVFDDNSWEDIDLPHDYSLTQEYTRQGEGESGYKLGGIGWYRKNFTLNPNLAGKDIYLHFDGAYMQTEVYLNGQKLAFHPYGYTAFSVKLTPAIKWDGPNVLAIKTNHQFPSSRWYSGSGIYRSVHLSAKPLVRIAEYGVKFQTPDLATNQATPTVKITTKLENKANETKTVKLRYTLSERTPEGGKGTELATFTDSEAVTLLANGTQEKTASFTVNNPKLWSVAEPNLYFLQTEVLAGEEVIQTDTQEVGFRYFNFDRLTGFSLNGVDLKLQGVCMHHDQGALGAKAYYDAILRQVKILKAMGTNSIRVTHNPSARALRDAANREGMLLIDEAFDTWLLHKNSNSYDYATWFDQEIGSEETYLEGVTSASMKWSEFDIKQMVKAGLNDPAVIAWSTGNEVLEGINLLDPRIFRYPEVIRNLANWVDSVDGTRPVTLGDNKLKNSNPTSIKMADALTERNINGQVHGLVGHNYARDGRYKQDKNNGKNWVLYGSETASAVNSRGIYNATQYKPSSKLLTSYDTSKVPWGAVASDAWYDVIINDHVAGEYVWTGFDYLGEPTPWNGVGRHNPIAQEGAWPSPKSAYFGIIDTAGLAKDSFYFYKSQWDKNATTLHILPTWNRDEVVISRGNVDVVVYSNAKSVELFFTPQNGEKRSLGKKVFDKVNTGRHSYQIYNGQDKKSYPHENLSLHWSVPFEDGKIEAVAYGENDEVINNTVGRNKVETHGQAHHLKLTSNKEAYKVDSQSLAYVEITVEDEANLEVSNAAIPVSVKVTGPAELVGLDNGHQADHTPYNTGTRNTLSGKLVAILKFTGKSGTVNVSATSNAISGNTLTLNAEAKNTTVEGEKKAIAYGLKQTIYLARGAEPVLPSEVTLYYEDESEQNVAVNWQTEGLAEKLRTENLVTVKGKVENVMQDIFLYVVPIDRPAAIKNISRAVKVGDTLELPTVVEAYLNNGKLIDATFPVVWDEYDKTKLASVNTFKVTGQADVLGTKMPVTASVRVGQNSIVRGDNVAPSVVALTQDIPENKRSDSLDAIKDRNRNKRSVTSGPNNSLWSNYTYAQEGNTRAKINFKYDTAQSFYEINVVTTKDGWSATHPKEIRFYADNQLIEGVTLEETTAVDENTQLKRFRLPRIMSALDLSVEFENADNGPRNDVKACVAVTEIELYVASENFPLNTSANLEKLSLEGEEVNSSAWEQDQTVETEMSEPEILALAETSNAAVTVLPPYEGKILIFVTSEDGTTTKKYTVLLETKQSKPAHDGTEDIDRDKIDVSAGSQHNERHKADNANDGDPNTIWHTAWNQGNLPMDRMYLDYTLEEPTMIEALRYLPRQGGTTGGSENGRVKRYRVLIKASEDSEEWQEVASGNWENSQDWKIAEFVPTMAKVVRLKAEEVYSSNGSNYMSAAEMAIRKTVPKTPITEDNVTATIKDEGYALTNGEATIPTSDIVVTVGEKTLKKGVHYKLVYENNTEVTDSAIVKIVGIGDYEGTIVKNFKVIAAAVDEKDDEKDDENTGSEDNSGDSDNSGTDTGSGDDGTSGTDTGSGDTVTPPAPGGDNNGGSTGDGNGTDDTKPNPGTGENPPPTPGTDTGTGNDGTPGTDTGSGDTVTPPTPGTGDTGTTPAPDKDKDKPVNPPQPTPGAGEEKPKPDANTETVEPSITFLPNAAKPDNYELKVEPVVLPKDTRAELKDKEADIFEVSLINTTTKEKIDYQEGTYGEANLVLVKKQAGQEVEKVLYIPDDINKKVETINSFSQTDKTVTFKINHLSKYALVYKKATSLSASKLDITKSLSELLGLNQDGKISKISAEVAKQKDVQPSTASSGNTNKNAYLVIGMSLLAAITIFITKKRKNK